MAAADRQTQRHLSFLGELAAEAHRCGLFPVVRGAEARAEGLPRVGRSRRPSQNVVDLAQVPTLAFAARTLDSIEVSGRRARIEGYWLGLTGPAGPLPTHLTEFAVYERRYSKTQPFGDFLDLLAGRLLQLFYRSWADSQPAAQADRVDDDRFALYLAALTGAAEGVSPDAVFPRRARLHYAALFASRRSAGAIEDALSHLLRAPVRVEEFQPRWRDLEAEDRSCLGRRYATLDGDAMLGRRARIAADAFRVVIRAHSQREYEALLPSGPRFAIAAEALDAFAPKHLEWDLTIEVEERKAQPTRLDGRARLGWTSWVRPSRSSKQIRADAHLRKRPHQNRLRGSM